MSWHPADLVWQYNKAKGEGWIATFREAAESHDFAPETLIAIASRETAMRNIKGDWRDGRWHGFGLMQIDIGSFPEWIATGEWKDPKKSIRKGADVLSTKRAQVIARKVPPKDALPVAIAAYNAGVHAIDAYFKHGNPDRPTTGHDYSQDVLKRAEEFKKLLTKK